MERSVGGVVSGIGLGIVEKLLNRKDRKKRNSGVSKHGSHDTVTFFSHIILTYFQFYSHSSGNREQTVFEAVIILM
jgi:hypothetical protein